MEHTSSIRTDMQNAAQQQQDQNGHEDMPLIDALASSDQTPHPTTVTRKTPSKALKKIKAQQTLIKQLQRQLQHTSDALEDSEHNKAELNELLQATLTSPANTRPVRLQALTGSKHGPNALKTLPIKKGYKNKVNASKNKKCTHFLTPKTPNPR
jgi:hypothetical protein